MELRTTNLNWSEPSNRELRLAIDMDEVLADTVGKQLDIYNRRYGTHVVPADLHGTELAEIVPPEHRPWVLGMLHEPGFFADLRPMDGALEVMERLCRSHRVYIASAATEFPDSFRDKMSWLARHLPQIPTHRIIFCGEKSVLDVDYLVDDTPDHFEGLRGIGLLLDAPHNRLEHRYPRVHGWAALEATIDLYEARKLAHR
jgi:5'(3')-deoxyribonucleotidase